MPTKTTRSVDKLDSWRRTSRRLCALGALAAIFALVVSPWFWPACAWLFLTALDYAILLPSRDPGPPAARGGFARLAEVERSLKRRHRRARFGFVPKGRRSQ